MEFVEYIDVYAIDLYRSLKHREQVDTDNGITIEFGYNHYGGRCKLTSVMFDKKLWSPEEAYDWWIDHDIRFVPVKKVNVMLPEIDFWLDPICNNYIVICYRTPKSEFFAKVLSKMR